MNRPGTRLRRAAPLILLAVLAALTGCFNPFDPRALGPGISAPPPVPDSPSNLLRLLEWAYNNRAISEYRELFTDDYRFAYSALDKYGEPYRDTPWTREDEIISATKLFQGGDATQPAATSITLNLDRNFQVRNDARPGKTAKWHKSIRTSVALKILDANGAQTNVTGFANFFVVRGDSALIPPELVQKGFGPDSSRWYIERWEDDTATGTSAAGPALAQPAGLPAGGDARSATLGPPVISSWGRVKAIYR
jgi:hypothetical protein